MRNRCAHVLPLGDAVCVCVEESDGVFQQQSWMPGSLSARIAPVPLMWATC